jgi:threonine dehydrogenase-like Zn-dependent dehydrogenase
MVGRNGVLADVIDNRQIGARILSCGGATEDVIHTTVAHLKGVNIQIGGGPMFEDWYGCLDLVISGEIDPTPLIGETVALSDLAEAIERARYTDAPVRILFKADR